MIGDTTIPREKVVEIVNAFRQLQTLEGDRQVLLAKLIRWCVAELRSESTTHRIHPHDPNRVARVRENRENKQLAMIYLDYVATQLEAAGGVDLEPPTVTIISP